MKKEHIVARLDGAESSGISRRRLIRAGAWAAPVIVLATASPAAAASIPQSPAVAALPVGTISKGRLRFGDFRIENRDFDGHKAGPIAWYLPFYYDRNINHTNDPASAAVPWTLLIEHRANSSAPWATVQTRSGIATILKYQWVEVAGTLAGAPPAMFPAPSTHAPDGEYRFTATIYGSDGALTTAPKSMQITYTGNW